MPVSRILVSSPLQKRDLRALFRAKSLERGGDDPAAVRLLQEQLHRLGYLNKDFISSAFDENTERAVRLFQRYLRQQETGRADHQTLRHLLRPRYDDLPDIPEIPAGDGSLSREVLESARYVPTGVMWKKSELTFSFQNFSNDLAQQQIQTVIRDAFAEWTDVTELEFYERPDAAGIDIRIRFGQIDAPGGTLAVATWWTTGDTIDRVEIEFDEYETWSAVNQVGSGQPIELFIVAVHEVGHAIGLAHSADPNAVMYAYYNPNLDRLTQDDINGIRSIYGGDAAKNILIETATNSPCAVVFNSRLVLGWAGTDSTHRLNVVKSLSEGVWFDKVTLGDTSPVGIALAVFQNRLYMAWTGTGNRQINVLSSSDGIHWGNKVTLPETSPHCPAITEHNGQLVVGWTGTGATPRLNVLFAGDGMTWGGKKTLGDTAVGAPTLTSFGGRLFIAWTGTNHARSLNVMSTGNSGSSWEGKIILSDTSNTGPSIRPFQGQLYLSWSGRDENRSINTLTSIDGSVWGDKKIYGDSSDYTPELVEAYGALAAVWTGRDRSHHLNVMTLS